MTNYLSLNVDLTDAKTQAYSFISSLGDIESQEYINSAHRFLTGTYDKDTHFPLMMNAMSSLGLNIGAIAHYTINTDALLIHPSYGEILIPLADFNSTKIKIYNVVPGAVIQTEFHHYLETDVSFIEEFNFSTSSQPIIVKSGLAYTIETLDSSKLSDFLVLYAEGGTNHLFT